MTPKPTQTGELFGPEPENSEIELAAMEFVKARALWLDPSRRHTEKDADFARMDDARSRMTEAVYALKGGE